MKLWDGREASTQAFESGVQVAVDEDQRVVLARHEGAGAIKPLGFAGAALLLVGMGLGGAAVFAMPDTPVMLYAAGGAVGLGVLLLFVRTLMVGRLANALHHVTVSQSAVICVLDPRRRVLEDAHGDRLAGLASVELRRGTRGGSPVLELVWPDGELVVARGPSQQIEAQLRELALDR